jgi:ergothioneine biosynthesis protein EgtB
MMPQSPNPQHLLRRFAQVRQATCDIVRGLSSEDCQVQSMPDASPLKWHLAHTTWFFETFVLAKAEAPFVPFHPAFRALFNSYYQAVGAAFARAQRGCITRPSLDEVLAYRRDVDARVQGVLERLSDVGGARGGQAEAASLCRAVLLGLHHEQQHQELMHTDLLHAFSLNPMHPRYRERPALPAPAKGAGRLTAVQQAERVVAIGHAGDGFAFDNETPRHRRYLHAYALSDRLVTQGEWLAFVQAGGYRQPRWWMSAGWEWVQGQGLQAPAYWVGAPGAPGAASVADWQVFSLHGLEPMRPEEPAVHISWYEADAFCRWLAEHDSRWRGARLPTEVEWEAAAAADATLGADGEPSTGHWLEDGCLKPSAAPLADGALRQLWGSAWEWTSSSYDAYPGFAPWAGDVGEYNGKFMANQYVLRGGSCVTPRGHVRASYRNFFPSQARWQFSGLRVAQSLC